MRRAHAKSQRRAELEQQLIGIVSYDLRSPLSAILMNAAAALRREERDERTTKSLVRIQTSAERATRLIADLLDFTAARLGSGVQIERTTTCLHDVARDVVEEIQVAHPDRLGLFISRHIVEAHGGTITVDSSEPDGTTFTVRLPRDVR